MFPGLVAQANSTAAGGLPLWFTAIFNFWTMFISVALLGITLVIVIIKLGPTGRFFLDLNLFPGNPEILLSKSHTNRLTFHRVKSNGRALQISKTRYMFLPDLKRNPDEKEQMFNDIIKRPSTLDGKIIHMGTDSASVAVSPTMLEALSTAKIGPEIVKNFFKGLEDMTKTKGKKKLIIDYIKILVPYQIQDIAELMNIVITPQRLAMVYREGELKGIMRGRMKEQLLIFVILILCGCIAIMSFFLSKAVGP